MCSLGLDEALKTTNCSSRTGWVIFAPSRPVWFLLCSLHTWWVHLVLAAARGPQGSPAVSVLGHPQLCPWMIHRSLFVFSLEFFPDCPSLPSCATSGFPWQHYCVCYCPMYALPFPCETVRSVFDILINFDLKTEAHEHIRLLEECI